jgi:ParB family chromosome partitioning protein
MKRKALGKGLGALLPVPDEAPETTGVRQVEVGELDPNPFQPRQTFRPEEIRELAASIQESGILQPIVVRPRGARYEIVAGERRFRAAKSLGFERVPVVVRELQDGQMLELALVENLQRQDLLPLEEAQAYDRLHVEFRLTQEEIARKVGKERATVANAMRLLRLPAAVKALLSARDLEAGHARALLALDKPEEQVRLGRQAAKQGLSVREVERRVALTKAPPRSAGSRVDANTRAAEQRLRSALGTRVQIARRGKAGQLKLSFQNESELQRLFDLLLRGARGRG